MPVSYDCTLCIANKKINPELIYRCSHSVGRSGEDESQEDVLMDEAPSNISQASTLQANREGKTLTHQNCVFLMMNDVTVVLTGLTDHFSKIIL